MRTDQGQCIRAASLPCLGAAVITRVLEELVILAEAIITAISKSSGRYPRLVLSSLREFIDNAPYFLRKTACRTALQLVKANVLSPKESKARLVLLRHGLPDAEVNCHVDRAMFDSGKPMSLDIAWKHFKVAVEYDGDHHRTDKHQWRRDRKKRDRLRQLGWTIIVITVDDIRDEVACAEFALNVARELTLRGCDVDFRVIAMTVEELARREKAADRKSDVNPRSDTSRIIMPCTGRAAPSMLRDSPSAM